MGLTALGPLKPVKNALSNLKDTRVGCDKTSVLDLLHSWEIRGFCPAAEDRSARSETDSGIADIHTK